MTTVMKMPVFPKEPNPINTGIFSVHDYNDAM
jgi:hypothetical protein